MLSGSLFVIERPYNYYNMWMALIGAYVLTKYVKKNFTQTEFDMRKGRINMFIPKFVYRIRREHYIYWEMSRLARGLPRTFTYSNWDSTAVSNDTFYPPFSLENDVSCGLGRQVAF